MSMDLEGYRQMYRQMRYAFGEPWDSQWAGEERPYGDFPHFPDQKVQKLKKGESRRPLNNAILTLSRVLTGDPEPDYPQLDDGSAEVRKQAWLRRFEWRGWQSELQNMFIDGEAVGVGFVQIGARVNPRTGKTFADIQHVPAQRVLWDRHVRTPQRAKWIAFLHEMSPAEAIATYKDVANIEALVKAQTKETRNGDQQRAHKWVRITEFYDMGIGGKDPTCIVFCGAWSTKPIKKYAHKFLALPFAHYEYVSVSGMPRPIGKILLQQATTAMINEMEARLRDTVRRGGPVDLYDVNQLDDDDAKKVDSGDAVLKLKVKRTPEAGPVLTRVPGADIAQTAIQYLQVLNQQFNSDSSSSELDRGSFAGGSQTATANQLLDIRSQQGVTLTKVQTLHMVRRTIETWNMVAGIVDRDPFFVDVLAHKVLVNDPANPGLRMDNVMGEYSSLVISQQSLERQDLQQRNQMELTQLFQLVPLAANGWLDPHWLIEQILKAMGKRDPQVAMPAPVAPAAPGMPGQPGMPPPGMPPGPPGVPAAAGPGGAMQTPGIQPQLPPGMRVMPDVRRAGA